MEPRGPRSSQGRQEELAGARKGSPWVALASKKEKMGSTFKEKGGYCCECT